LRVCEVQDGLLRRYNQANPDTAVCPGDRIMGINGCTGNAWDLRTLLTSQDTVEMTVVKAETLPMNMEPMDLDVEDEDSDDCDLLSLSAHWNHHPNGAPLDINPKRTSSASLLSTPERAPCLKRRRRPVTQQLDLTNAQDGASLCSPSPVTPSASSTSKPHTPEEVLQKNEVAKEIALEQPVTTSLPPQKTLSDILRLLPRPLAAPTDQESHLYQFWNFVTQALLGKHADDSVCRAFKLGGSIDQLSDVAFSRDHIVGKFGRTDDLCSIVWHQMLICWLGAGGPRQRSYQWLCQKGFAKRYCETDSVLVSKIYTSIEALAREHGFSRVFDGDSRAVKFRLDSKQQGEPVLQSWFQAVPQLARALTKKIAPDHLERELRSIFYVGELTAKELFVLLSYARPSVADTVRHTPVGPGARDGAMMVLRGEAEKCSEKNTCPIVAPNRGKVGGGARRASSDSLEATRLICDLQEWALRHIPRLAKACEDYRATAPHRDDPLRNGRIKRPYLFDLADIEVMLCYYKNYVKMRRRFGRGDIPPGASVRGWERRL